jgi:hypothetical protein
MAPPPDPQSRDEALRDALLALLRAGDVDGAVRAGLMEYDVGMDDAEGVLLRSTQQQLATAWAARERHRARAARLARTDAERAARRAGATPATTPAMAATAEPQGDDATAAPAASAAALPAAAAAALARARAKAQGRPPG